MKKILLLCALSIVCMFNANAKTVLTENFNLFTAGSDTNPDGNYMTDLTGYTQTSGWSAMYVCQAGGSVYFPIGSNLITPAVDVSDNGGNYVVTFKAKSDSNPAMVLVSDQYMSSYGYCEINSQWQEYSITLTGGTPTTQIAFQAMYNDFYLDDLVVMDSGIEIPVATASSNFTRQSFTVNWAPAQGAKSYLLDVFTYVYNYETTIFEPVYILKDKEVLGTSYVVTEGEFDVPYYYEVASKDGNIISKKSNRVTVFPKSDEVAAPVAKNATNIGTDSFLASWEASDIATKYYLHVAKYHKAATNQQYTFINTDYSEFTEGTLDAPRKELEYRFDGDWKATVPMMANGCIGINNEDIAFFGQGSITSPLLHLGKGDKVINVNFKAIARMGMKKAFVQLTCYDRNGIVNNVKNIEFNINENNWEDINCTFNDVDGSSASVTITSTEAGRMFIDDLHATISLVAGDELILPVRTYNLTELEHTATNLNRDEHDRICYYVSASWAVRHQEGVVRQIPEVLSPVSNTIWVDMEANAIDIVSSEMLSSVLVIGNTIHISNPTNAKVVVLSLDGKIVSVDNTTTVVTSPGIYVVAVGTEIHKVIVK